MKICFLANSGSIHTKRWVTHFAKLGHDVSVISFDKEAIEGIKVINLVLSKLPRRLNILWNLSKVRQIVRGIKPDVVHAHYVTSYGLAGALAGRHPLVISAWGSDVLIMPEQSCWYRLIVRFVFKKADLITSMAKHMTHHLISKKYASAEKIVTLPFGVNTEVFNVAQRERRSEGQSAVVASTRSLDIIYDVQVFIQAISEVKRCYPNVRFVVAGDGPLRSRLEKLAMELRVQDDVEFRGGMLHADIAKLLGQSDIFVTTSRSDGSSISLIEAMACGAFPIVTDIPANRAWIEHGRNGLYFPCGDVHQLSSAIIRSLRQPEWRERVTAENWEIVNAKASWSHQMAKMEHYYHELLKRTIT